MKLRIIYNHENLRRPVLSEIILGSRVPVNIIEAKITPTMGDMLIEISASAEKLREVISMLQKAKVKVQEVTQTLEIDLAKCISCGACVSPCPTKAIIQKQNWDVEFDDNKCVKCRICVDACPVRAIQIS